MNVKIRACGLWRWVGWVLLSGGLLQAGCSHPSRPRAPEAAAAPAAASGVRAPDLRPMLAPELQAQLNPGNLPAVGDGPGLSNPYRGQASVVAAGRSVFHAACARCHGVEAEPTPEAPDLRRLNAYCRRVLDAALQDRCQSDVDRHFWASVHEGKVRAGVVYMPSWAGTLTPEAVWAVRTYLESLTPAAPARKPDRAANAS